MGMQQRKTIGVTTTPFHTSPINFTDTVGYPRGKAISGHMLER
jgi:hypothetical protein